jgi:hypothetical protein
MVSKFPALFSRAGNTHGRTGLKAAVLQQSWIASDVP